MSPDQEDQVERARPEEFLTGSAAYGLRSAVEAFRCSLKLFVFELAHDVGPFTKSPRSFVQIGRKNLHDLRSLLRLLEQMHILGHVPRLDAHMEAAKALGERFEEDVVERLASVAPDDEQKAWGQVNEIRKQLQPILQTTGCVLGNLEVLLEETVVLQPNAGEPERKAVVSVDLVRYRELVKLAHDTGGMDGARGLNRSIGNLITDSVAAIGISVKDTLVSIHGDEATLAFEAPLDAVEFAEQLHLRTDKANENMGMTQAYKYFRIGIALGEVSVTKTIVGERVAGASVLGSTIVDAVQLREACLPGEVVISHDVWAVLPGDRQSTFGPSEEVPGKHPGENTIPAHRRRVVTEK